MFPIGPSLLICIEIVLSAFFKSAAIIAFAVRALPSAAVAVFDVLCTDTTGARFLIEVQNAPISYIRNRILYYTCRLIDQMGQPGDKWNYNIDKVYSICLMNFMYEQDPVLKREFMLQDPHTGALFTDRIHIVMLQLPCLDAKSLSECNLLYEKLLYLLNEMTTDMRTVEELKAEVAATQLPDKTKEVFYQVLDTADIGSLSEQEQLIYESNLKAYRDTMSCIRFAEHTGREEGRAHSKLEIARSMKIDGMPSETISKYTGLSVSEVENL